MQYIEGLEEYCNHKKSAVTFGKFDGLHLGHRKLIEKVKELGEKDGISTVVCALDMSKDGIIMTKEERKSHLESETDYLINCPFSQEFRRMWAIDFIRKIIKEKFHAKYVVVGEDFHFGYGQAGNVSMLLQYAEQYGYETVVIKKKRWKDEIISSTYIKEALKEGNTELAGCMLGYPYGISGVVRHGKKLGRTLGFPTFNVEWPKEKLVPRHGVYLTRILVDGKWYNSISNVGIKPTVSKKNKVLTESFLFDYEGNAYGKDVTVELLEFRRPERKFDGIEELKEYIDQDIIYGKSYFGMEK